MDITQEILLETFDYKDGHLYWKVDRKKVKPGQKAGRTKANGYCEVRLDGKLYGTHRLIFMMFNGYVPSIVDHIDGNPSNNHLSNLRCATHYENMRNAKIPTTNTSGFKGVTKITNENKWIAQCWVNGKKYHLGCYEDINKAADVVKNFRQNHHGAFCRHK